MEQGTTVDKVRFCVFPLDSLGKAIGMDFGLASAPSSPACSPIVLILKVVFCGFVFNLQRVKMLVCHRLLVQLPLPTWSRRPWVQRGWIKFCKVYHPIAIKPYPSPTMELLFCAVSFWTMQLLKFWSILPKFKTMKSVMVPPASLSFVGNYCTFQPRITFYVTNMIWNSLTYGMHAFILSHL